MGSSSSRPKQGVLMVGMDGPCKSSILERLSRGEIVQSVPTIGFHVQTAEQLSCADMAIVTWNFSGSNGLRPLWCARSRLGPHCVFVGFREEGLA